MPASAVDVALPPLLALAVSALTIGLLLKSRAARLVLDQPNHRSLHATPTPRIGGLGIVAGVAIAGALGGFAVDPRIALAAAALVAVSLVDDLRSIGAGWRMLVHLACAALAAATLVGPAHDAWTTLAAVLAIGWLTNLYNFMDGSDGLAGCMALCGFSAYGIAALAAGDAAFAALNFSIAAAALGFLFFNFPPARVFMGDAGAIPLGFLAAVCALAGWQRGDWPLWFGGVVFSPFIVDASLTLTKRLARGERVWQAHREHYYQRLVQCGWGHRRTLLAECALMLAMAALALAGATAGLLSAAALLTIAAAVYLVLIAALERTFRAAGAPRA